MRKLHCTNGLYAIIDVDAWKRVGVDIRHAGVLESVSEAIASGGTRIFQLRNKEGGGSETLDLLRRLRIVAQRHSALLIANDRVDLALLSDADGVHLGQTDLSASDARALAPRLMLGLSTHSAAQLIEAIAFAPSYVAFGPVYPTSSKLNADGTVGVESLGDAVATSRQADIPLVAIGGISIARASEVAATGARWIAVIGELVCVREGGVVDTGELTRRARQLTQLLAN